MLYHEIRDYDNRCGGNENCAAAEVHCPGLTWMGAEPCSARSLVDSNFDFFAAL